MDFAGPYYYASIVCVTKTDSPYANAAGISDLSGRHLHRADRHHLV